MPRLYIHELITFKQQIPKFSQDIDGVFLQTNKKM